MSRGLGYVYKRLGYGYIPNDTTKEVTFFYHSDHLGSTSYITDDKANITQYDAYLPYGELLVDEHSSSEELPYKFNGKQFDEETGLYYYGARYMNPVASLWYGVDRLAEKYSQLSLFSYCAGNPIKYVDAMNVIRQELNMQWKNFGQRLNYKSIIPNEKATSSFLPFDRSSLNSIKMGMNPSPFSQYIEINVRK